MRLSPFSKTGFGALLVVTELMLHGQNFCLQESVVEGKNVALLHTSTYWEGICTCNIL